MTRQSGTAARLGRLGFVVCVCLFPVSGRSQDLSTEPPVAPEPKNWTEDVARNAELIDVFADLGAESPAHRVVAYKWSNTARGRVVGDRLCLLYVEDGRPIASCKVYPTGSSIVHAFVSMSDDALVGLQSGTVVWSPSPSAPNWRTIPDTAAPYASAAGRRVQMKQLAREYRVEIGAGEARRQRSSPQLRLLPQSIYRYEVSEDRTDGVMDGAVFAFVAEGETRKRCC